MHVFFIFCFVTALWFCLPLVVFRADKRVESEASRQKPNRFVKKNKKIHQCSYHLTHLHHEYNPPQSQFTKLQYERRRRTQSSSGGCCLGRTRAASLNHGSLELGQAEETSIHPDRRRRQICQRKAKLAWERGGEGTVVQMQAWGWITDSREGCPAERSLRQAVPGNVCASCVFTVKRQTWTCSCCPLPSLPTSRPQGIDSCQSTSSPFSPMPLDHTKGLPSLYVLISSIYYTYSVCHFPAWEGLAVWGSTHLKFVGACDICIGWCWL